jgi:two-component system, OmpR family, response regulator
MSRTPRILVVEDDSEIRLLLKDYLQRQSLRVDVADGGAAFDRLITQYGEPDLVVLDIMLPGEDGFSICRRLRATSHVPVIMLTARSDDIDRIVGLEMGADDYLAKPFNPRELLARIRAVLRRMERPPDHPRRRLSVGALTVDLDARTASDAAGAEIELTSAEFELLACFVTRPGRVLSRDQLMDWTRGRRADALDRTIDVQVSRLRKKIEGNGAPLIKTVRSAGYILAVPVEEV